jgi:hypothetical protein
MLHRPLHVGHGHELGEWRARHFLVENRIDLSTKYLFGGFLENNCPRGDKARASLMSTSFAPAGT